MNASLARALLPTSKLANVACLKHLKMREFYDVKACVLKMLKTHVFLLFYGKRVFNFGKQMSDSSAEVEMCMLMLLLGALAAVE